MISGRQIRAARALLNWDAERLAKESGVTRVTISRIETESVQAQEQSLIKIHSALDKHGIEFTEGSGIRLKMQNVEILEGTSGFINFFSGLYDYLEENGGTVIQSGVDEKLFTKYMGAFEVAYMERMAALFKRRNDTKMQILVQEGDYNFTASSYATYRWQSKKYFSPTAFYVFGNRLALISFAHEPAPLVITIKSSSFAEAYRNSFAQAWNLARVPPVRKKKKSAK